uniref:hypothetical protein n=1 Tax=Thaumasiovibrio occultus TaxID=1891184 RepID=UPI00131DD722|nr:hypothetical protein [Thaumasiovibrio occultus]
MKFSTLIFPLGIVMASVSVLGCSSQQMRSVGIGNSPVTAYPQHMTDEQLCEIQIYGRQSTQTKVAVAAEYTRRGLTGDFCHKAYTQTVLGEIYDVLVTE